VNRLISDNDGNLAAGRRLADAMAPFGVLHINASADTWQLHTF
jgi:hypothetical protein